MPFFIFFYHVTSKSYMNELRPHSNESDSENGMTKKYLKELKVITYTNNVIFLVDDSIITTS